MSPQPNPIQQSNLPGIALGDVPSAGGPAPPPLITENLALDDKTALGVVADTSTLVISNLEDVVQSDAATPAASTPMVGNTFYNVLIAAVRPSWLDGAGNITEPGLYAIRAIVRGGTFPTVRNLCGKIIVPVMAGEELVPVPFEYLYVENLIDDVQVSSRVIALGSADLPFAVSVGMFMPADETATSTVRAAASRLAYRA